MLLAASLSVNANGFLSSEIDSACNALGYCVLITLCFGNLKIQPFVLFEYSQNETCQFENM